jgi:hypothetical protein
MESAPTSPELPAVTEIPSGEAAVAEWLATSDTNIDPNLEAEDVAQQAVPDDPIEPETVSQVQRAGKRTIWQQETTKLFLELLLEARNEGKLGSEKSAFIQPVMQEIGSKLRQRFSNVPEDIKKLMSQYDNMRKRHRAWLWMDSKSGTYCDPYTGIVEASDENWAAYRQVFSDRGMWLRRTGLPNAYLYKQVYADNKAAGLSIITPAEAGRQRDADNTAESAEQEGGAVPEAQLRAGSKRQMSETTSTSRSKKQASQRVEIPIEGLRPLFEGLRDSINSSAREPGAIDVEKAISDCQQRFGLSGRQFLDFAKTVALPMQAVIWNGLGDDIEAKRAFFREFVGTDLQVKGGEVDKGSDIEVLEDLG